MMTNFNAEKCFSLCIQSLCLLIGIFLVLKTGDLPLVVFLFFFRRSCRSTLAIISVQTSRSTVYY